MWCKYVLCKCACGICVAWGVMFICMYFLDVDMHVWCDVHEVCIWNKVCTFVCMYVCAFVYGIHAFVCMFIFVFTGLFMVCCLYVCV